MVKFPQGLRWVPSDSFELAEAERAVLYNLLGHFEQKFVATATAGRINTIQCVSPHNTKTIVLLHGFAFGLGQWIAQWVPLAQHYNVFALDLPGFGRSDRPDVIASGVDEAVSFFTFPLEEWMIASGAAKDGPVTLIAHSFGGYLASFFALRFPELVDRLVLVDPWGIEPVHVVEDRDVDSPPASPLPAPPVEEAMHPVVPLGPRPPSPPPAPDESGPAKLFAKAKAWAAKTLFYKVSPLCVLRGAGPLGPQFIKKYKRELMASWAAHYDDDGPARSIVNYVYHCNAQKPSGELAFSACAEGMGMGFGTGFTPKKPLADTLATRLDPAIGLCFIYGAGTWVGMEQAKAVLETRSGARDHYAVVPHAGHHVYIDQRDAFNDILLRYLRTESKPAPPLPPPQPSPPPAYTAPLA
jgi:pimeloyl-ACP methyl ester carboxylesterase